MRGAGAAGLRGSVRISFGGSDRDCSTVTNRGHCRRRTKQRMNKLRRITASPDTAVKAEERGTMMTPEERFESFGDFDPDEFSAEASERWGSTNAYTVSARRTNAYTPADWKQQRSEADDLDQRFLALMDTGIAVDSETAATLVDAHRGHVTKWFYECTPEIHAGLGAMYGFDERFRTNINETGEGLAEYLSAAIEARYAG